MKNANNSRERIRKKNLPKQVLLSGGGRWIRTTEGIASRFTVCPLWPLGKSPIFSCCLNGAGRRTRLIKKQLISIALFTQAVALIGAGRRTRTPDLLITNQLLYQLSYTSKYRSATRYIITDRTPFVNTFMVRYDIKVTIF